MGSSETLNERIAAAVAETRAEVRHMHPRSTRAFILAACDHADKVLARHRSVNACWHEGHGDPCPEVRDLADLWLGPGGEAGKDS